MGHVTVAIVPGEEIAALFRARDAHVLNAGRHMNPSVGELLEAVETAPGDEVVLLANDPHVVPAARQVPALTKKSVGIVPSRGICEGLAALAARDPDDTLDDAVVAMTDAASSVRSVRIDLAIRASAWSGGQIRSGDWIAIDSSHGVIAVDADLRALLEQAVRALTETATMLTIVSGDGADDDTTQWLSTWPATNRPGLTVDVVDGGASVPRYVLGAR
ncbi:MAG: hypothetical protein ACXVQ6_02600 [Actinomycetota bacterium]